MTPTRIFVFGSNLAGRHGKGAALTARREHGAIPGQGIGQQGRSYAIPTKDYDLRTLPLDAIRVHVEAFYRYALIHPAQIFEVTRIGCGLAGYSPAEIAPLFRDPPSNVYLPPDFVAVLEQAACLAAVTRDAQQARRVMDQAMAALCAHHWIPIASIYRAETDATNPIRHTAFRLLGCRACRAVDAFPMDNVALATPRYLARLAASLRAGGWRTITWRGVDSRDTT